MTAAPIWQKVTDFYVNIGQPRQYIGPLFCNSYTGQGPASDVWQTVDLTVWGVPVDAKAVYLNGILIITSGAAWEVADLGVIFRASGDTSITPTPDNYTGQTVFQNSGNPGGQRSNMGSWVPVVNGQIEWAWHRSTTGQWPTSAAYGVNLSIQAWAK